MEAWRTSCPRLTIWEDAVDRGLVVRGGTTVEITPAGRALLEQGRR
jgi:DNA-binding transcriptional LysR family regulator